MRAYVIKNKKSDKYLLDKMGFDYVKDLRRAFLFKTKKAAEQNMREAKEGNDHLEELQYEHIVPVEIKEVK